MKISRKVIAVTASVTLIGFVSVVASFDYAKAIDAYAPMERTAPKKLLHISGQISQSLSVKISLHYTAANDKCKVLVSWVAGAYGKRTKRDNIPVRLNGNKYDAIVPIDKYEEGYCRWTPFSIEFHVAKGAIPADGPDNMIWIQTLGNTDPDYAQDGTAHPNGFTFRCKSTSSMSCVPEGEQNITTEAKELHIDIVDVP